MLIHNVISGGIRSGRRQWVVDVALRLHSPIPRCVQLQYIHKDTIRHTKTHTHTHKDTHTANCCSTSSLLDVYQDLYHNLLKCTAIDQCTELYQDHCIAFDFALLFVHCWRSVHTLEMTVNCSLLEKCWQCSTVLFSLCWSFLHGVVPPSSSWYQRWQTWYLCKIISTWVQFHKVSNTRYF